MENPAARAEWELAMLRDPATGLIPEGIRGRELAYAATLPIRESQSPFFKSAGIDDYTWNWRGPFNVGGRTRALAADISGEDTLLAGAASGGMWRSTDRGATWTRTTLPSQIPSASCIVQDIRPGKTSTWYYGTGELVGASQSGGGAYYNGNGIFKSTDNGRNWALLSKTAPNSPQTFVSVFQHIWNMALDPSDTGKGKLYAAMFGTISRSTDGGTNWSTVLGGSGPTGGITGYFTDVAVTTGGVVYATISSDGAARGIWRSVNGAKWTKITPPFWTDSTKVNLVSIGIAPSNQNVVYFVAETPGFGHLGHDFKGNPNWGSLWKYTYDSGDGSGSGGRWEDRSANLPSLGGSFGDFNPQGSYNLHVHVKPDDENIVFIGGTNLYRSTVGFATASNTSWIGGYRNIQIDSTVILDLEYANHHPDQHTMIFSRSNPSVVLTGSDGGVHRTEDIMAPQVTWNSLDNGYATTQFYSVAIDHLPGSNMIIGGLQDNGTWRTSTGNAQTPWTLAGTGDGSYCQVADGGRTLYVSKQEGKAYRVLLDENGNMTAETRIDPLGGGKYLFINPFVLDPVDQKMMYLVGGGYVWRNSDLTDIPLAATSPTAVNWTRLDAAHPSDTSRVTALGVSTAAPSHRLYVGTDFGTLYRIDDADAGDPTAANITGASFPKKGYISCIAVDPLNGDRAIVVFSNYSVVSLFATTDAGETWSAVAGNLEQNPSGSGNGPSCRWASILHRGAGTIYLVGTSTGLYSSVKLDSMKTTWSQEGASSIGNTIVDMIDVRQADGFVAVGTHGSGVYSTTIATLGVGNSATRSESTSLLEQNYPNPVAISTTIPFNVPSSESVTLPVRLVLYDLQGREVSVLVDERRRPGHYTVAMNLAALERAIPNGTYYYRLQAGETTQTRAMQVVR